MTTRVHVHRCQCGAVIGCDETACPACRPSPSSTRCRHHRLTHPRVRHWDRVRGYADVIEWDCADCGASVFATEPPPVPEPEEG